MRILAVCLALAAGSFLKAGPLSFVGFYQVDEGPYWATNPLCYTAQEGAALIFGGIAADYEISINSNIEDPGTITGTGWYSEWGINGGQVYTETFKKQTGSGYNDPAGTGTALSAYIRDNAIGPQYTDYVWKRDASSTGTPEPGTFGLLLAGLAAVQLAKLRAGKGA